MKLCEVSNIRLVLIILYLHLMQYHYATQIFIFMCCFRIKVIPRQIQLGQQCEHVQIMPIPVIEKKATKPDGLLSLVLIAS